MKARLNYAAVSPETFTAMRAIQDVVNTSGLEPSLKDLVVLRASQLNNCAFCIDMHTKDARAAGETEERLYMLQAWREVTNYSERERAALAWTEAVTLLHEGHVPDDVYDEVRTQFSEEELVKLTLVIATINMWNRFAISFRMEAGHYKPAHA
ncbi:MAG: carboxymuconolactone decarboxylase family protein [Candidatus Hydrogenedentes bacterium]|nr:carboxymuconolactone decarboxylase family protein [Candidatus Hydrogenedentota bacterium]